VAFAWESSVFLKSLEVWWFKVQEDEPVEGISESGVYPFLGDTL
jgi:hypothetical protein